MPDKNTKYQAAEPEGSQPQRQQQQPQTPPQRDFVVRPRFGSKSYAIPMMLSQGIGQQQQQQQQPREITVQLSSVLSGIDDPASQAQALEQLGIRLVSKSRVQLHLQEYPPGSRPQQINGSQSTLYLEEEEAHHDHKHHQHQEPPSPTHPQQQQQRSLELQKTFSTRQPVLQPLDIQVSYLRDAYIEADTAFCCLLEANTPFGDRYSVPVLGRGSFNFLGDAGKSSEHCVSGASAGFLQRAALTITVALCLCELSREDERAVVDFYRQADRAFGYGQAAYIDYLVYCCQTESASRDSYLKYLCLEFNNRNTQDRMTRALTHFMEHRRPTERFWAEAQTVMTPEELEKDREAHFSVKARASKYLSGGNTSSLRCCPCNTM